MVSLIKSYLFEKKWHTEIDPFGKHELQSYILWSANADIWRPQIVIPGSRDMHCRVNTALTRQYLPITGHTHRLIWMEHFQSHQKCFKNMSESEGYARQ